MYWYAVNTKCHSEHVAEVNLRQLGVETFYPLIRQRKMIRRKLETVIIPLFPGYLFARFKLVKHFRAVTYAKGVRKVVTFGSVPAMVDDHIIESIRSRIENGYLTVAPPSFKQGQVVRIQEGPFKGLEALFEREMSGHQRAVLLLKTIAYQARVVVPFEQVVNR